LGALRVDKNQVQRAAVFAPELSEAFVSERLERYAAPVEGGKLPSLLNRFETIETVEAASASSLWTDTRSIVEDQAQPIWWECWTWQDKVTELDLAVATMKLQISARRLIFPEVHVVPVYANMQEIENLLFITGAIEQLRYANDLPSFFTHTIRREQNPWVDDLKARVTAPKEDSPAVCLLDSGVAQGHPLLSEADCLSVNPEWGTADDTAGHGTKMAGTILYEDLTYSLADQRTIELLFRLESVKFLPPEGFEPTDPENYGSITQIAVSTIEIHAPERDRVFCMAVTNMDVSGERPSSWSAALDQAASGAMVGDREDENTIGPRRLSFSSPLVTFLIVRIPTTFQILMNTPSKIQLRLGTYLPWADLRGRP
jgi:hypothetical protein